LTQAERQVVIYIRAPESFKQALQQCVNNRGSNISVFSREVIGRALAELSYLTSEKKKALGLNGKSATND
jgi:hypothetical protein